LEHGGNVRATADGFGVQPLFIYWWLKSFRMNVDDYRN
jgi:hypothetical protein